jgi:glucose-6-phosphate dehydrogenase assembly protein OpcA
MHAARRALTCVVRRTATSQLAHLPASSGECSCFHAPADGLRALHAALERASGARQADASVRAAAAAGCAPVVQALTSALLALRAPVSARDGERDLVDGGSLAAAAGWQVRPLRLT